jgi:hypothetical protein
MPPLDKRTRLGTRLARIEALVERRVEEELDAVLDVLEENLTRDEFVKVAEIIAFVGEPDEPRPTRPPSSRPGAA